MKLYHLSDLHFGKAIYGLSMIGDQKYWADRFIDICRDEHPDAVLIAGDVYDRSAPSGDAVELLDEFLTRLADMGISVFMIAGNHDSGQRLAFGKSILSKQKIHISGVVKREIDSFTMDDPDGYGPVTFWLLPYTFPEKISAILSDDDIRTYDQALRKLIEGQNIDASQRNIIVSHQNVVANGKEAERGGSESMAGGVGQIDYSVYDAFDYAALGHIHSSYSVGREEVRYAGTPLCYHLAETRQKNKGFVEIVINAKGEPPKITQRSITPLHKMRFIKDTRDNIYDILRDDSGRGEYIGITITDQRTTPEINAYLKELLNSRDSVLLELLSSFNSYANTVEHAKRKDVESLPIEKLFENLYTEQCGGTPPTEDEYKLMEYVGELVRNQDTHMELDDKDVDKILNKAKMIGGSK